jgi:tetratricopeptide (TPR) repeat protein
MLRHRTVTVLAITLALSALLCHAAPDSPPTREQIARWIEQLGADDFQVREKASQALWKAGDAAESALKAALKSSDAEVVRRATDLLDRISWGITPTTPEPVVKLIRQYRSAGEDGARETAIRELFKLGKDGYVAVRKIAQAEEDAEVRKKLAGWIAQEGSQAAGVLLAEGETATAEELLEAGLTGGDESALRNYAVYHLLRGSADKKSAELRSRLAKAEDKHSAQVLTFLYRAQGDLKNARWAAERAGKPELLEAIQDEQGDWKAVARSMAGRPVLGENVPVVPKEGTPEPVSAEVRALYHRLAGNTKEFEADLARIRAHIGWAAARGLFANDRPHEAITALADAHEVATAFEFLVQQTKLHEALELADKGSKNQNVKPPEKMALLARKAGLLYVLGKKDEALKLFNQLGDGIKDIENLEYAHFTLVGEEYRVGLTDLAFEHCARLLARDKDGTGNFGRVALLERLFAKKNMSADLWWNFLRPKFPDEETITTLKRVRDVMEGKMAAKALRTLLDEAEQASRGQDRPQRERWLQVLSEAAQAAGDDALALSSLERDGAAELSANALQQQGDFLAERKRWKEAAQRYRQAWEKDRESATLLFLHGWALQQSGRTADGEKLMERARLLPLAREEVRSALIQTLVDRGLTAAAHREREVLARTGSFRSIYVSNVLDDLSDDAVARKDYSQAAENYQRINLIVQHSGASYVENEAYLLVPSRIHLFRACELAQAGQVEEARKEADVCLDVLPGDVDAVIAVVRAFEKGGHKAEADRIFDRMLTLRGGFVKKYPQSGWSHNSVAWLLGCCRRDMDTALEHAKKAVELAPKSASYWDTLAEVYFQRGDKARTIETAKKCIELEPKTAHYRKQLQRFEAGDRDAPIPQ